MVTAQGLPASPAPSVQRFVEVSLVAKGVQVLGLKMYVRHGMSMLLLKSGSNRGSLLLRGVLLQQSKMADLLKSCE